MSYPILFACDNKPSQKSIESNLCQNEATVSLHTVYYLGGNIVNDSSS